MHGSGGVERGNNWLAAEWDQISNLVRLPVEMADWGILGKFGPGIAEPPSGMSPAANPPAA